MIHKDYEETRQEIWKVVTTSNLPAGAIVGILETVKDRLLHPRLIDKTGGISNDNTDKE